MAKLVFLLNEGCTDFGALCVRDEYNEYSEPKKRVLYWPVNREASRKAAVTVFPEMETGAELSGSAHGGYTYYRGYGCYSPVARLENGGRTEALKVETLDVPCPKVRKGVPTRYRNGNWEKYLRAEGWVHA